MLRAGKLISNVPLLCPRGSLYTGQVGDAERLYEYQTRASLLFFVPLARFRRERDAGGICRSAIIGCACMAHKRRFLSGVAGTPEVVKGTERNARSDWRYPPSVSWFSFGKSAAEQQVSREGRESGCKASEGRSVEREEDCGTNCPA